MTINIMFTKTLSYSPCELACLLPIWYIIKAYPKYLKCMISLTFHGSLIVHSVVVMTVTLSHLSVWYYSCLENAGALGAFRSF